MKIVVAPDSFKGSMTALEVCQSIERGINNVMDEAAVDLVPMADGGEGTVENLTAASRGNLHYETVNDPFFRKVEAAWGVLGDGETAVIETAAASGLQLLTSEELDPFHASSFGTGELIRCALDKGYRRFILGLGGSATNDAGMGLLRALGIEFYDKNNLPIPEGGGHLHKLDRLDTLELDPRVTEAVFLAASDVQNVLCGTAGASAVFGPQKGADSEAVKTLDNNLRYFAVTTEKQLNKKMLELPGGGAAGGIGAALISFLQAELIPGIELVMSEAAFSERLETADLVITGEGKLDSQTLDGKVINGVAQKAGSLGIPVVAVCGQLELSSEQMHKLGILAAFSLIKKSASLEEIIPRSSEWLTSLVENMMRLILVHNK
ncbi:glycerate kinase [Alkalicoccus saliphilus]|uniref:Glycerate kinase n=1 Tax=Alkalicoccus saliphilus TaxID=200989 RepID=A0A2T4U6W0_9BACI|nr:glycerate kinase [Alkalicoccus saliphilus]PTL39105.1 glycerate kinase [Alkalicoccus saliphilus]